MGKPSKVVATDEGVPGMPVRMPAIRPPESPPTSTLTMVARPWAGGMPKVKGRVSTTAMAMVKPGNGAGDQPAGHADQHEGQGLQIGDLAEGQQDVFQDHGRAPPAVRRARRSRQVGKITPEAIGEEATTCRRPWRAPGRRGSRGSLGCQPPSTPIRTKTKSTPPIRLPRYRQGDQIEEEEDEAEDRVAPIGLSQPSGSVGMAVWSSD